MKRRLFRRILLTYIIIAPLLLVALELYLSDSVRENYVANLRESLTKQARLIADGLPSSPAALDNFCRKYKQITGARVTIVDSTGKVLGDSDEPSELMENHADRPEIRDADISGTGHSIRFSNTLKKNLFYLAITVGEGPDKRFLRLSLPLQEVETAMGAIRLRIIIASLAALIIAIIIGLYQTRKITKSIGEIAEFAKEIAGG
ncbi:MAG: hypothetical protein AB1442_12375, partial [Nitrospirota bacterium]